uniref:Uncharacterized protein n=1 Tax=Heterorhabditis bacteriophora TaxID=37862 RepID=A0A1I7WX93_HETBA
MHFLKYRYVNNTLMRFYQAYRIVFSVTYITAADAKIWKDRFHRDTEPQSPVINRLSPKVFPKFYRSPYLSRKTSFRDQDDSEPLSETSEAPMSLSETCPLDDAPINEADKASEKIVDELEIDSFVCNILNVSKEKSQILKYWNRE